MEEIGNLKSKFETQKVSDRFQKREFILTTEANTPYPQHVSFQVTQDKCSMLDQFGDGDEIRVQFNLRGREWNGPQGIRYFNTLEAWRIEGSTAGSSNATSNDMSGVAETFTAATQEDDLPF